MRKTSTNKTITAPILCLIVCVLLLTGCSLLGDGSGIITSDRASGEESIETFVGSVKLRNGDPETMYRLAVHYQKTGHHDWAIEEFRKILAIDPSFARAYNGIGVSLDCYKKYELAQKAYLKALEIDSELDYAWNNLGYSTLLQGKPEAAAAYFGKAITLRKGNTRYRNNLALAKEQMKERGVQTVETLADLTLPQNYPPKKVWKKIQPYDPNHKEGAIAKQSRNDNIRQTASLHLSAGMYDDHSLPMDRVIPPTLSVKKGRRVVVQPFKAMAEDVTYTITPVISIRTSSQRLMLPVTSLALSQGTFSRKEETMSDFRAESLLVNTQRLDPMIDNSEGPYIEIANGNGINGMAATVKGFLKHKGFPVLRATNAEHFGFGHTRVLYRPGSLQQAWAVAKEIPGQQNFEKIDKLNNAKIAIKVILGKDMQAFYKHFKQLS